MILYDYLEMSRVWGTYCLFFSLFKHDHHFVIGKYSLFWQNYVE